MIPVPSLLQVLEKLHGHLELLGQEFLTKKEKHLTLKQQVYKHESPAASDFDPERSDLNSVGGGLRGETSFRWDSDAAADLVLGEPPV